METRSSVQFKVNEATLTMARLAAPKHKTQRKPKPKPKSKATKVSKKSSKPQKLKQTRLSFEAFHDPYDPSRPPRGGARMERTPSERHSSSMAPVESPSTAWKEVDYDGSSDPLDNLGKFSHLLRLPTGPRRLKISELSPEHDAKTKSPSIISVNSSPPSSPNPIRSGMKRNRQSKIDDHFLLTSSSSRIRRRSTMIESDSESDTLDQIQLEPEASGPQTPEPASDNDSDDLVSPGIRRRRHLPPPPKEMNPHTEIESDDDSDTLNKMQIEADTASDNDSDDILSPGIRRRHHLPPSRKEKNTQTLRESEGESDMLDQNEFDRDPSEPRTPEPASGNDSDDVVSPRVRRRRHLPPSPGEQNSPTASEDVPEEEVSEDEVRDIASSVRKSSVSSRMRDPISRNKRKSAFQKNLENLLKKKQGLQESDEDSDEDEDEEEGEDGKGLYDSESDVDSVKTDDFVVDEDKKMSLEELMEIPPEFTSASYQGPQLNFKVAVQGEVYALLHPDYHNLDYSSTPLFKV